MKTFYWHDYETWGADPSVDRPSQFAGVRTDEELNIIDEPLVLYCRPPEDVLPHPEACLVTGIAPQKALNEGVSEAEFIARIHQELLKPDTCTAGYNNLRFDDEVTRYTLFRNYYDPYEREWANGNSRWDIIDMLRCCYALRPEGIEWPIVDGKPSFRLENLTAANGISHLSAHDAFSDVEATIAMAKRVKQKQTGLYEYLYANRGKHALAQKIDLLNRKPLLHISSKFPSENGCAGLVVPLALHPQNKNAVIVYNLSQSPSDLLRLSSDEVAEKVFASQDDLAEGDTRIPLKLVHLNKCPVLLTPKFLDSKTAQRLLIDRQACEAHWQQILQADAAELELKVQQAMTAKEFSPRSDPERQLYDGFIASRDKAVMAELRKAEQGELASRTFAFEDKRLSAMLLRYKARNFPESLKTDEMHEWFEFCQARLEKGDEGVLSVTQLQQRIEAIDAERDLSKNEKIVLQQLYRYSCELASKYQLGKKCSW